MIHLEEKEKREKEMRNQIINEAEEYKKSFYEKRKVTCETNKANNREREKVRYPLCFCIPPFPFLFPIPFAPIFPFIQMTYANATHIIDVSCQ